MKYRFDFFDGLALVFIHLKLTEQIDWSWVWVLSPLWFALVLLMLASLGLGGKK